MVHRLPSPPARRQPPHDHRLPPDLEPALGLRGRHPGHQAGQGDLRGPRQGTHCRVPRPHVHHAWLEGHHLQPALGVYPLLLPLRGHRRAHPRHAFGMHRGGSHLCPRSCASGGRRRRSRCPVPAARLRSRAAWRFPDRARCRRPSGPAGPASRGRGTRCRGSSARRAACRSQPRSRPSAASTARCAGTACRRSSGAGCGRPSARCGTSRHRSRGPTGP
jgi:hypothetical protein